MENKSGRLREIAQEDLLWAMGSVCALHRMPFAADLLQREFPPPCSHATLIAAGRALRLRVKQIRLKVSRIEQLVFPVLVALRQDASAANAQPGLGLVTAAADGKVVFFQAGSNAPQTLSFDELAALCSGEAWLSTPEVESLSDPDAPAGGARRFGFRWFIPELLKHRQVWRDVLLASLALQLVATTWAAATAWPSAATWLTGTPPRAATATWAGLRFTTPCWA